MAALQEILAECPFIPQETKYWFVRTNGGEFYPGFIEHQVVGLDYSKISLEDLKPDLNIEANVNVLKAKVFKAFAEEHGQPGMILAQLLRFKNEMKKGDYVLIPFMNTKLIAIGQITDDKIIETQISVAGPNGEIERKTLKTKSIHWIKRVKRSDLNPKLHLSFWSHQTIVEVTKQSEWVDSLLYDFYRKGDEYNYVVKIGREGRIPARELYRSLNDVMDLVEMIGTEFGLETDVESMGTSINVNSKGPVRFISKMPSVGLVGLVLVALLGGEVELEGMGFKLKAGFKGTVADEVIKVVKFIREIDKEDGLKTKVKDLEVEKPTVVPVIVGAKPSGAVIKQGTKN